MIYFIFLILGVILLFYFNRKSQIDTKNKIRNKIQSNSKNITLEKQALNLHLLTNGSLSSRIGNVFENIKRQLGKFYIIIIICYTFFLILLALYVNSVLFKSNSSVIAFTFILIGYFFAFQYLQKRDKNRFESSFSDALNMLSGAVSSGESLVKSISYVGDNLDGDLGREFKRLGERLRLGESPEISFRKACDRFPYPEFYFFAIALQANMKYGGQLKMVMSKINRLMFDARNLERKKKSLTAEARLSVKIVASVPFLFLIAINFIQPETFQFIFHSEQGKPILYYLLGSESLGLFIVWRIMKGSTS
ncbi:TPA: type II secretion system F family protein [Vibrio vulnificus]|nr:pilus assembly protein TadB [Vibrio vulnificus]HDY8012855.1 type II secretion system F family protein [Vibrio vulnificus]